MKIKLGRFSFELVDDTKKVNRVRRANGQFARKIKINSYGQEVDRFYR